jgi:hypothetical protein
MEKYVLEALFQMGYDDLALARMRSRFQKMVEHPTITTMWEGWGIGSEGYGGGTINHAWSGGGLTLLSQYVAGVFPLEAGYGKVRIRPQPGQLKHVKATVPSVRGQISVELNIHHAWELIVDVPEGVSAVVELPAHLRDIRHNSLPVKIQDDEAYSTLELPPGQHQIMAQP